MLSVGVLSVTKQNKNIFSLIWIGVWVSLSLSLSFSAITTRHDPRLLTPDQTHPWVPPFRPLDVVAQVLWVVDEGLVAPHQKKKELAVESTVVLLKDHYAFNNH